MPRELTIDELLAGSGGVTVVAASIATQLIRPESTVADRDDFFAPPRPPLPTVPAATTTRTG